MHAGLLLTGGSSSRMGRDKASMVVGGASLAERAAAVLRAVARPVVAVGPEAGTGLPIVDDPRQGPLVAFAHGVAALALRGDGHAGPAILLACDMPFVTAELLQRLEAGRRGAAAAVPIARGRLQPLCAIYTQAAQHAAARLVADGARSMQDLLAAIKVEVVPADDDANAFDDLDTPQDVERATAILEAPA